MGDFLIYILERAREALSSEVFSIILLIVIAGLIAFIIWIKKQHKKEELKLQSNIEDLKERLDKQAPDNIAKQAVELNNNRRVIIDDLTAKNKVLETHNQELQDQIASKNRYIFKLNLELEKQNQDDFQYCYLCDPEDELQDLALLSWDDHPDYDVKPSNEKDKVLGLSICGFCQGYHIKCGVCGETISFGQERVKDDIRCDLCNTGFVLISEKYYDPITIYVKTPN